MKQMIYGRYQYPIGNTPTKEIFKEYRDTALRSESGLTIGGYDVCVSGSDTDPNRTAIILSYDLESETFLRLKFCNREDVQYRNIFKEKQEHEAILRTFKDMEKRRLAYGK
jgi:hypothetical protein